MFSRSADRLFQYHPDHTFRTRGRCQGSTKAVDPDVLRQQSVDIHRLRQYGSLINFSWHLLPGFCQLRISFPFIKHQRQNSQRTLFIFIDKMSFQRELFAIDLIFTWCVEMKLLQCKSIVVQTQGITFTNVNLNTMAIVDYLLFPCSKTRTGLL